MIHGCLQGENFGVDALAVQISAGLAGWGDLSHSQRSDHRGRTQRSLFGMSGARPTDSA